MFSARFTSISIAGSACLVIGCIVPINRGQESPVVKTKGSSESAAVSGSTDSLTDGPSSVAPDPASSGDEPRVSVPTEASEEDNDLVAALNELDAIREIDPQLHSQLKDDLKEIDSTLWLPMAKSIRARLAYRQQVQDEIEIGDMDQSKISPTAPASSPKNPLRASLQVRRAVPTNSPSLTNPRTTHHGPPAHTPTDPPAHTPTDPPAHTPTDPQAPTPTDPQAHTSADPQTQVSLADFEQPDQADWRKHLSQAIQLLEAEIRYIDQPQMVEAVVNGTDNADEMNDARIRLLYLVNGRLEDAERGMRRVDSNGQSSTSGSKISSGHHVSKSTHSQSYWPSLMRGLGTMLDEDGVPVADRRAAEALTDLRTAVSELANLSTLKVNHLAICSAVDSYGSYTEFNEDNTFQPDQELLLYVEVDNFTTLETPEGYVTALDGSYRIVDTQGVRVAEHSFKREEDFCRNRRRDYFIPYRMWMPKTIAPGKYTLQLTIEDVKGKKFGQSSIEFRIEK